jgi:hypothetical protein
MAQGLPPLMLIRAFQNWEGGCGLYDLFACSNARNGIVVSQDYPRPISWSLSQEIVSVAYCEPFECVHARKQAFPCVDITLDDERALNFPGRYLLTQTLSPSEGLYERGNLTVEWLLTGLMEVPAYCLGLPLLEQARVELGLTSNHFDISTAARSLKPNRFDIVGAITSDRCLRGAIEFDSHLGGNHYLAHFIGLAQFKRELRPEDLLHGRCEAWIGETHLTAERPLLRVVDVGLPEVPPLRLPGDC